MQAERARLARRGLRAEHEAAEAAAAAVRRAASPNDSEGRSCGHLQWPLCASVRTRRPDARQDCQRTGNGQPTDRPTDPLCQVCLRHRRGVTVTRCTVTGSPPAPNPPVTARPRAQARRPRLFRRRRRQIPPGGLGPLRARRPRSCAAARRSASVAGTGSRRSPRLSSRARRAGEGPVKPMCWRNF